MNAWTIVALVIGLVLIAGVFVVAYSSKVNASAETNKAPKTSCGSCNGGCTAEKNCGAASCGATSGGTCNCGK